MKCEWCEEHRLECRAQTVAGATACQQCRAARQHCSFAGPGRNKRVRSEAFVEDEDGAYARNLFFGTVSASLEELKGRVKELEDCGQDLWDGENWLGNKLDEVRNEVVRLDVKVDRVEKKLGKVLSGQKRILQVLEAIRADASDPESSESEESEEDEDDGQKGGPEGFFDLEAKEVDEGEMEEEEKKAVDPADAEGGEEEAEKES